MEINVTTTGLLPPEGRAPAHWPDRPFPILLSCLILFLALALSSLLLFPDRERNIPLINKPAWWQLSIIKKLEFLKTGVDVLDKGRAKSQGKPFRVLTELGEMIVLPNRYANEIRNNLDLDFRKAIMNDFHSHLRGFDVFALLGHKNQILQRVVRKQLTKQLNVVTLPLSEECTHAVAVGFGESEEWEEGPLKERILDVVARISSRVFLGDELCRNPKWLDITKQYTVVSFRASFKLQLFPRILRPLVAIFEPDCRNIRACVRAAKSMIHDVLESRQREAAHAMARQASAPQYDDAIAWAEAEAMNEAFDPAVFQLTLSLAAIHTTSDLLTTTLLLLAERPQLIPPLREEMQQVLRAQGWSKNALYNLKLLDSAIKEAQRKKPNTFIAMRRLAIRDVELSDGVLIRKGERTVVDASTMWSPEVHAHPEQYNIHRFESQRGQSGYESRAQLVTTHPDQLVFGHGHFACPGRFFASNEIKIALCHLLLKYDWAVPPGHISEPSTIGGGLMIDPTTKVMYRRRREEFDLMMF